MPSETLRELSQQYRLISTQLREAVEQEFRPWSVVWNSKENQHGLFISHGVLKNWLHVKVGDSVEEWRVEETYLSKNQDKWPGWIKKAKGIVNE